MRLKTIASLVLLAVSTLLCVAQSRVDKPAPELSWKSKELNNALYWSRNGKTGKWESRKCSKMVYLGEGVRVDNYHGLFLGTLNGSTYLFLDKRDYFWRYPTLETEWMYARHIYAALLSDEQLNTVKNLPVGKAVVITPTYVNEMSRAHEEYSFPFFLSLTETLKGVDLANQVPFITFKRVVEDNGNEVVRFCFGAVTELIDISYFEVDYNKFNTLFTADSKTTYK